MMSERFFRFFIVAAALTCWSFLLRADAPGLALAAALPAPVSVSGKQHLLRVATYNVHIGLELGGELNEKTVLDFRKIGALLRSLNLDLAAINEIDSGCQRTHYAHQPALLSKEANMGIVFAQSRAISSDKYPDQGPVWGNYGVAALARKPLLVVEQFALPLPDTLEPRTALIVRTVEKNPVYLVVTHLPWEQTPEIEALRVRCVEEITRRVKAGGYAPVLIAGDFNASSDSPTMRALRKEWSIVGDGDLEPTFPADKPRVRLDYIAFAPKDAFEVVDYQIVDERKASDHRPFVATLHRKGL